MTINAERMRENLDLTYGALFSQRALTALVESGMTRDDAYRVVQENAQRAWDTRHRVPRPARRGGAASSTSTRSSTTTPTSPTCPRSSSGWKR